MRKLFIILMCTVSGFHLGAQDAWTPLDNSPMDLIYLPVDYPILKIRKEAPASPVAKIMYSRPIKKSRKVFGDLLEYGIVWRLGANEATEVEFFKDVKIADTKIRKGRYSMFAIPYEDKWTIIFNKDTDVWGAFAYDESQDILRTDVLTQTLSSPVEAFTMKFEPGTTGALLIIAWENTKVSLPIVY